MLRRPDDGNPEDDAWSMLTLKDAKEALRQGRKFGDVFPYLADKAADGEALKQYFVEGRHFESPTDTAAEARAKGYAGDPCPTCGSMSMIRDGKCLKCLDCGSTNGGCS